jgi:hypothetical protein
MILQVVSASGFLTIRGLASSNRSVSDYRTYNAMEVGWLGRMYQGKLLPYWIHCSPTIPTLAAQVGYLIEESEG